MEHKKITLNIGSSNNIKEKKGGDDSIKNDNNIDSSDITSPPSNVGPQTPDYSPPPSDEPQENNINMGMIEKIKEDEQILDEYVDNFYSMKNDYESKKELSINRKKEEMVSKENQDIKL